jgi:pleiotropic regulator 1
MQTLTYHKKGVRALALHPTEFSFASASTGTIKKCSLPEGTLVQNFQFGEKETRPIIHSLAVSRDGKCLVSGMDNGYLRFWDWTSGKTVQNLQIKTMPGTLESEAGVTAVAFDMSGERIIACVGDKTVQTFKPDSILPPSTAPEGDSS